MKLIKVKKIMSRLEKEAAKFGSHIYVSKTENMLYNQEDDICIKAEDGRNIKLIVDGDKNLGSYVCW